MNGREGGGDRELPVNAEAELNVLGSVLLLPDSCDDLAPILRPDDFHDEANRVLYGHLTEMHSTGKKIDLTLLRERLISSGDYDRIGGAAFLAKVIHAVTTAAHAVYYAEIVREKATLRRLITAATEIVKDVYAGESTAKEALGSAEQRIFSILDERGARTLVPIRDVLHEAMDRIDARMRGEATEGVVDSGFTDLDAMTGGLHASELIILAARPSMGKTAFAMNIAENVAVKSMAPVLFVSLEMSAVELIERLLCSIARVNGHRLRNGTISQDDRRRLADQAAIVSECPFYVDDSPGRTVSEIAAAARRIIRRENRIGLVVIDYLQLIEPDNPRDPRQEQVAKIARRLKGLARELKVPVLCLAQLNRQAEDSREHRPRLSHLRESGAIEQDADVVMFVHREEYYVRGEEQQRVAGQAQIFIEKQRNGPTGDINMIWRKEFTRFEDRAPERFDDFDSFNGQPAEMA
ncbi:MAG TPA: replicative DNA helicase [Pirellulaceae bacterium]|nr:replicative DNA helicase [Pirellulaceae bacterium]